jgi:hypothetical protein
MELRECTDASGEPSASTPQSLAALQRFWWRVWRESVPHPSRSVAFQELSCGSTLPRCPCPPQHSTAWRASSAPTARPSGALDPGTQALLTLAHLHKGEPLATLAAGFGISAATAWRRTRETTNTDASRSSFRAYGSLGA